MRVREAPVRLSFVMVALSGVHDLIPIIIESDDHWWPRDFQRLALISPAWLTPVRKRLYAAPSLWSFRTCKLFARTLRDNPTLLSYLRGLELRPTADGRRPLDEEEMQDQVVDEDDHNNKDDRNSRATKTSDNRKGKGREQPAIPTQTTSRQASSSKGKGKEGTRRTWTEIAKMGMPFALKPWTALRRYVGSAKAKSVRV